MEEDRAERIEYLRDIVRETLRGDIRSRENDNYLIMKVWQKIVPKLIFPYELLDRLPQAESITRLRRDYQSRGLFLPSDDVLSERRKKEKDYKEFFGGRT